MLIIKYYLCRFQTIVSKSRHQLYFDIYQLPHLMSQCTPFGILINIFTTITVEGITEFSGHMTLGSRITKYHTPSANITSKSRLLIEVTCSWFSIPCTRVIKRTMTWPHVSLKMSDYSKKALNRIQETHGDIGIWPTYLKWIVAQLMKSILLDFFVKWSGDLKVIIFGFRMA